jgi:tetratricopeptide (TPR) repeat protein
MAKVTRPFRRAGAWVRDTAQHGYAWAGRRGKAGMTWFRKRPRAQRIGLVAGAGAVVLVGGLALAGVFSSEPTASAADLEAQVAADPRNADGRLALGHALFREGKKAAALAEYERALALDGKAIDDQLITNLASSFGDRDAQPMAAVLIVRHKLVQVEDQLDDKTRDERHWVRWPALYTLEKIGLAGEDDELDALRADLAEDDCGLRRRAVARLAKHDDPGVQGEVLAAAEKNKACPRTAAKDDDAAEVKPVVDRPADKRGGRKGYTAVSPI